MTRETRLWVRKAENDLLAAQELAKAERPFHDNICHCCQQSAEKYLKALLEELGRPVPRTHNLDDVLNLLRGHHPTLRSLRRGLIFLTDFAVETRYPGDNASKRQAVAALRWANRVRNACRTLLGLGARRKKSP